MMKTWVNERQNARGCVTSSLAPHGCRLGFPNVTASQFDASASDKDTLYPRSYHSLIFAMKDERGTLISPRSAVPMNFQPEMGLILESSRVSRRSSDLRSGPLRCISTLSELPVSQCGVLRD
jgi:hypothetical protein